MDETLSEVKEFLEGSTNALALRGGAVTATSASAALMPGAFDPFHSGHRRMIELAASRLSRPVDLELSIRNVDKPDLSHKVIGRRLGQFRDTQTVWLTRAATFVEKSLLFPNSIFVVGADTIRRVADPAYYKNDVDRRDDALSRIAARKCQFLVFGRVIGGVFRDLEGIDLPDRLRRICVGVAGSEFRVDVSSTALRSGRRPTE